jgi:crescentin
MTSAAAARQARPRSSGFATNWKPCSRLRVAPKSPRWSSATSSPPCGDAPLSSSANYRSRPTTLAPWPIRTIRLAEHSAIADKHIVELEGELSASRERVVILENEKRSLQNSHEQLVSENAKLMRRINETDNTLANVRNRLEQIETQLATSETERNKLTASVDEANERRQAESNTLNMRLEAMQSRATAAEKLLGEVRQSLISRTEENRLSERKVVEATIAKNTTEKKLEQLLASLQGQERQIRDLDGSRITLVERSNALTKTVKSRETALARAEERVQTLSDQIKQFEADAEANRIKTEKRIEELSLALQREKMERAVADGALEATRKNYAELQRELAVERSGRREETKPELVASHEPAKPKVKQPEAEKVEPIIPS